MNKMELAFPLRATFLALPLDDEAKQSFQKLQNRLKPYDAMFHFQNADTPHLTLKYWPTVMDIEHRQIVEQAAKIAARQQPFVLKVTGAETFGERGMDRVLFLSVAFSPELAKVKKDCPWSDGKPFAPHITLAWIRHQGKFRVQKKKIMKLLSDASFEITFDRLRLYAEIEERKQTPLGDFFFEREYKSTGIQEYKDEFSG